jgi:glycosyltransferase involved in cell wall biosynthesis
MTNTTVQPYVSIIIPAFNEADNLLALVEDIQNVMMSQGYVYEIIFVNDGSTDHSKEILEKIAIIYNHCKIIHLKKNCGQTAAMMAGIDFSAGEIIVPMDADLQNDPADIPNLLSKLDEGYDVCSGWRKKRKDNPFVRTIPSKIANFLIKSISGIKLNDYGCTLKAYRREIFRGIRLYGEMHRFIPLYASWNGARVTEIPVNHRARFKGNSKYDLRRTVKVILDLMVIKFIQAYFQKPIYVFGGFGLFSFLLSFLSFGGMLYFKYFGEKTFIQTPLPLLTVLFFLIGVISIFMGFLAQIIMMTYYESQDRKSYIIAATRNLE